MGNVVHYKKKLKSLVEYKFEGFQVRSRSSKHDEEDVATLYHANKEMKKKKGKKQNQTQLTIAGQVVSEPALIKREVDDYYCALYNGHHRTVGDDLVNTGEDFQPSWGAGEGRQP